MCDGIDGADLLACIAPNANFRVDEMLTDNVDVLCWRVHVVLRCRGYKDVLVVSLVDYSTDSGSIMLKMS